MCWTLLLILASHGSRIPKGNACFLDIIREATQVRVTAADLLQKTALFRNFFALHRVGHALGIIYPKVPATVSEFETALIRAKQIVEGWGGEFSLLFIPDARRFGSLLPTDFAYDQLRDQVVDAAAAADVGFIDLIPTFRTDANPERFYADDGHFSEEGADFIAGVLSKALRGNAETSGTVDQEARKN